MASMARLRFFSEALAFPTGVLGASDKEVRPSYDILNGLQVPREWIVTTEPGGKTLPVRGELYDLG